MTIARWEWMDKWTIDNSSRFGQPDVDGWFFASSFDRISEMLKNVSGVGVASATSMVRRRRWVRNICCTSKELADKIRDRIDHIITMRLNIETSLREKENTFKTIRFYEENRAFVYAQSLHLATQGTLNTLSVLKELINKLKLLQQVSL